MLPTSLRLLTRTIVFCLSLYFFLAPAVKEIQAIEWQPSAEEAIKQFHPEDEEVSFAPVDLFQKQMGFYGLSGLIVPLCTGDGTVCISKKLTAVESAIAMMGTMYDHPPASSIAWARQTLADAGLAKPVYAQGIGFAALSPFLPLWQATRNIAYSLLILVMIVIGFMLIFRTQIDAHTVISVQAALPKIIFAILLITFSYPIVGLMVDLMYLSIAVVVSVLFQGMGSALGESAAAWQTKMMTGGADQLLGSVFSAGFWSGDETLASFWGLNAGTIGIGGLVGAFSGVLWPAIVGFVGPAAIFLLLLSLGLLFVFIRLLMLLANAYIQVIISLILGPLILLNEAIPGRSAFKDWLFNIMANLSVFPATAMVLMFASFLTSTGVGGSWSPPFLPNWPGAGRGFFGAFLGISVMFLAPNLVVGVKKMFAPKPSLPVSAGTIFSPLTGGAQTTMGMASQYYYFQQMFGHGPLAALGQRLGISGGHEGGHAAHHQ